MFRKSLVCAVLDDATLLQATDQSTGPNFTNGAPGSKVYSANYCSLMTTIDDINDCASTVHADDVANNNDDVNDDNLRCCRCR